MSPHADHRVPLDPYEVVARRCCELGLGVWRCNPVGVVLHEPQEEGLLGIWHNASPTHRRIARAVGEVAGLTPTEPIELEPGCWLIVIPEIRRKRLGGYVVAMALGEELFETDIFADACASGQLDLATTRHALRLRAVHDRRSAAHAMDMLRWMVGDLEALGEMDETVTGFTEQLGNAYETIDLLYALGHSTNEPNEPAQFIAGTLERLHETLEFAWISAVFVDDPADAPIVNARAFAAGSPTMPAHELERACRELIERVDPPMERHILSDVAGFDPDGGPQVVVQPILRTGRVAGFFLAGEKGGIDPQISSYDTHLLEAAAGYVGPFLENVSLYEAQARMFVGTLRALTSAIDAKDPYTCGHSERVAHVSAMLARELGYPDEAVERIHIAGMVHDVGKIGVPEGVLRKPGRLSEEEFAAIRMHPEIGHRILCDIPMLQDVLPGVLHHHERWDGKGYPYGLGGEDIPRIARIIGIADTFDAMSSNRAYRSALTREKVLQEIRDCSGTQFDPELIEPFMRIDLSEYDEMVKRSKAQSIISAEAA